MATVLSENLDLTLNQTSEATEVTSVVTASGVGSDYDFIVSVDVTLVRKATPTVTEHYFVARKYTKGTWAGTDTFQLAIAPMVADDDTISAKGYGSYVTTITS